MRIGRNRNGRARKWYLHWIFIFIHSLLLQLRYIITLVLVFTIGSLSCVGILGLLSAVFLRYFCGILGHHDRREIAIPYSSSKSQVFLLPRSKMGGSGFGYWRDRRKRALRCLNCAKIVCGGLRSLMEPSIGLSSALAVSIMNMRSLRATPSSTAAAAAPGASSTRKPVTEMEGEMLCTVGGAEVSGS